MIWIANIDEANNMINFLQKENSKLKNIERIAKALSLRFDRGGDPMRLEPGDLPRIDGILPSGDKAHFRWRDFIDQAQDIVSAVLQD